MPHPFPFSTPIPSDIAQGGGARINAMGSARYPPGSIRAAFGSGTEEIAQKKISKILPVGIDMEGAKGVESPVSSYESGTSLRCPDGLELRYEAVIGRHLA